MNKPENNNQNRFKRSHSHIRTALCQFAPTMVVGRNSLKLSGWRGFQRSGRLLCAAPLGRGDRGLEPPCPSKGMHRLGLRSSCWCQMVSPGTLDGLPLRYHVVMWSLDSSSWLVLKDLTSSNLHVVEHLDISRSAQTL